MDPCCCECHCDVQIRAVSCTLRSSLTQVLCVIPISLVRWILCGVAFLLSGFFLVANVYPVLASVRLICSISSITSTNILDFRQADKKAVRLLIILLVALHAGIALCFKVLFFSYYIKQIGPKDPIDPPIPANPTDGVAARFFAL